VSWSDVVASLSFATVTGGASAFQGSVTPGTPVTGTTADWEETRGTHAVQVTVTGVSSGPSGSYITVQLQGSLDGTNWYNLASVSGINADGTSLAVSSTDQPAKQVRVVATGFTNGYGSGSQPSPISGTISAAVVSL
jgi:hypothetical protein